jgi:hypothetical protein
MCGKIKMDQKNIYGNLVPPRRDLKGISDNLIGKFREHFSSLGYSEHPQQLISSGVDKSVRLIGSHTSVLKPYFIEDRIPKEGIFMSQNCIRTRNLKCIYDNNPISWGSYFTSLGALSMPTKLDSLCFDTFNFLTSRLGVDRELIKIRANSQDVDLIKICLEYFKEENLELNTRPSQYYKHGYGLEEIFGRNFNIALKDIVREDFTDIGNIIIIESGKVIKGVELGFGNSTILKQLYGLNHVLDIYNIEGIKTENDIIRHKFEDAIIVATALYGEGLKPLGYNRGHLLKKYLNAIDYFYTRDGMSLESLEKILFNFEIHEFSQVHTTAHKKIIEYLKNLKK